MVNLACCRARCRHDTFTASSHEEAAERTERLLAAGQRIGIHWDSWSSIDEISAMFFFGVRSHHLWSRELFIDSYYGTPGTRNIHTDPIGFQQFRLLHLSVHFDCRQSASIQSDWGLWFSTCVIEGLYAFVPIQPGWRLLCKIQEQYTHQQYWWHLTTLTILNINTVPVAQNPILGVMCIYPSIDANIDMHLIQKDVVAQWPQHCRQVRWHCSAIAPAWTSLFFSGLGSIAQCFGASAVNHGGSYNHHPNQSSICLWTDELKISIICQIQKS